MARGGSRGGRQDELVETLAKEMARADGYDPERRVERVNAKTWPRWCEYRPAALAKITAERMAVAQQESEQQRNQPEKYQNSPLKIVGDHEEQTITQMRNCMKFGNTVSGVICADGHLGYAQPVGGVIAYKDQISISGVGLDISCGNAAVRLDVPFETIKDRIEPILNDIQRVISFGIGRRNAERVEHELFDDNDAWLESDMEAYRQKAISQLGTVGSGNHYVDLFKDEHGFVWIGVHFGSRGLGHTTATKYVKLAGGKDGMHVPPTVVDENSELGKRYIAAMHLAGEYAYAGRDWVIERVRKIIGGNITDSIHNNHNFAWKEVHNGEELWVVRKGATPAFPGQRGFVGGSMGDDAVIIEGVDSPESRAMLYSTIHGAGRVIGRKEAKRLYTREQMNNWVKEKGVLVAGGDVDESPLAYRRLSEVLKHHAGTIKILNTLSPFAVAMAGGNIYDPWKD